MKIQFQFQCDSVSDSYGPWLPCPDLWLSPGLPLSRAACCDPLMATAGTAICGLIVLVMDSCLRDGLTWKWVHSNGDVRQFLLDNLFRPQLFLSASQWLSPLGPDSDRPPLTHKSEGFVKLSTRHREWLTQSRWWIIEHTHYTHFKCKARRSDTVRWNYNGTSLVPLVSTLSQT